VVVSTIVWIFLPLLWEMLLQISTGWQKQKTARKGVEFPAD